MKSLGPATPYDIRLALVQRLAPFEPSVEMMGIYLRNSVFRKASYIGDFALTKRIIDCRLIQRIGYKTTLLLTVKEKFYKPGLHTVAIFSDL